MSERGVAIGSVIGRYRVDAILGTGGMGVVARARDLELDRDVALKVVLATADPARDRERAQRLLHEARTMARLDLPHVRAVHDVGTDRGIDYVAMEYIAGVDLATWLATPRSAAAILDVLVTAGRALAAAHAAGIVHRDIKPENILIGDDGEVCVSDFGIAHWLHAPGGRPTAATPAYAAPELATTAGDARSDQYSFAVMAREATAGLALPARARRALDRATAADPAARFATLTEVVGALDGARRRPRWPLLLATTLAAGAVAFALRPDDGVALPAPSASVTAELLAEVTALRDRGFVRSGQAVAEAADRFAHGPATELARGLVALDREDTTAARPLLETAARDADRDGDDASRARALLGLYRLAATRGSDRDAIARAATAARAALGRIPPDRELTAWLGALAAIAADQAGELAEAKRGYLAARAMLAPPTAHELLLWCELTRALAALAAAEHDLAGAIALDRELVATADRIAGRDHVTAISGRGELAIMLERAGQPRDADAVMAELRAAGATAAGRRLLAEQVPEAPAPERTIRVHVTAPGGAPIANARIVAATELRSSATGLVAPDSLYAERARATTFAATGGDGTATLAVPRGPLWIVAETDEAGRSPAQRVGDTDHVELALAPWGRLAGTAPADTVIAIVPVAVPDAPRIEVGAPAGRFAIDRIPQGRYAVLACASAQAGESCHGRGVTIGAAPVEVALAAQAAPTAVLVHPTDELGRPIETTFVALVAGSFAPPDLRALETGWVHALLDRDGATASWTSVHGAQAARLAVAPGHYTLCAAAIHGDTEDPGFAARLAARSQPVPMYCTPLDVGAAAIDRPLAIPAASRVWLGDPR